MRISLTDGSVIAGFNCTSAFLESDIGNVDDWRRRLSWSRTRHLRTVEVAVARSVVLTAWRPTGQCGGSVVLAAAVLRACVSM